MFLNRVRWAQKVILLHEVRHAEIFELLVKKVGGKKRAFDIWDMTPPYVDELMEVDAQNAALKRIQSISPNPKDGSELILAETNLRFARRGARNQVGMATVSSEIREHLVPLLDLGDFEIKY